MSLELIGIGASALISGFLGSSQANRANEAAEEAQKRQYEYDVLSYTQNAQKLVRDYNFTRDSILSRERNFDRQRAQQDQIALDNYNYQLANDKYELQIQQRLFNKSEKLYRRSVSSSADQRDLALESVQAEMREGYRAAAFDNEETIIKQLQAVGQATARGAAGRSAGKIQQSLLAEFGRDQAILAASLVSSEEQAERDINAIHQQFDDAILDADANRMLPPTRKPIRPAPYKQPDMEFLLPPPLQDFDFGPAPIMGAVATQSPSMAFLNNALSFAPSIIGALPT